MYLLKSKRTNHSIDELKALDNNPKETDPALAEFLPLYQPFERAPDLQSIFDEVSYWRKFNALHNWFVTHVQIGVDNCEIYEVTKDHINDLLDTLFLVIEEKDPSDFMPTEGFFFGSNEVDEYYWEQVENTRDKMYRLLKGE